MAAHRPHVVIVTAAIHAIGASLFSYALAPALGARRSIYRASSDPLSPLLRNYLRYEKTGSISSTFHPNEVSYGFRGPLESDALAMFDAASKLGSDLILWDVSGPACGQITADAWRDLATTIGDPDGATVFVLSGLTQWSKRNVGLISAAFPRTVVVANLLFGRPESFPKDFPSTTMPALDASGIHAIDTSLEPLDDLARKTTLTTGQRASLSAFADAVAGAKRYLPTAKKDSL